MDGIVRILKTNFFQFLNHTPGNSIHCKCECSITLGVLFEAHLNVNQMWNVFDSTFILVFLAYICLRIKGLAYGDRKRFDWCLF